MKILHIALSYVPAYSHGGPIASVHAMNKWLVKNGADVTVYTTDINGRARLNVPLDRETLIDGVKVFYFPLSFRPWVYSRSLHKALKENVRNFDLIHITSVFLSASALGAHYAKKFGVPYIISPRGSLMREPLRRKSNLLKKLYLSLIEKKNLAGAAAIHFTAEAEEDEYREAGLPERNSFIVPNGLDTEALNKTVPKGMFRKKFGISPERKIALSLGRLNWKKGFDTLIPAFRMVAEKEPKAILVIAGGDEEGYKKTIDKLIAGNDLEIGRNVIFTGELLGDMKLAAFREGDVFVLPSYSENFGMTVAEAMELGLPAVVSSGTAIAHYFTMNKNTGVVLEKGDTGAWAEKISWLFKNPEEAEKMAVEAKKLAEKEFSMEKVTERMVKEYNLVVADYPRF